MNATIREHQPEQRNDIHIVSTNYFCNSHPLVTRTPRVPIGMTTFSVSSRVSRPPDIGPVTLSGPQYCQTWRHPVQSDGRPHDSRPYTISPGAREPFDANKMFALRNLMDDMEFTSYYGVGQDPATSGRPKQNGLRELIKTNCILSPENANKYRPADLIRDTLERCRSNGGDPDVLLLSSNFMIGLAIWGQAVQRIDAGKNVFGVPIDVYEVPFLGGVTIIEAPLLKPFTAVCLGADQIWLRMKRNEFWNPTGSRGDAIEGEWIAEGAIELENEHHHAWVEGITGFSQD